MDESSNQDKLLTYREAGEVLPQLHTLGVSSTHGLTFQVFTVGWDRSLLPQLL